MHSKHDGGGRRDERESDCCDALSAFALFRPTECEFHSACVRGHTHLVSSLPPATQRHAVGLNFISVVLIDTPHCCWRVPWSRTATTYLDSSSCDS